MVSQYGAVVLVPGWTGWLTEISADLREAIVHHRRVLDDALTNPPQLLFYFRKNGRDLLAVLRLIIIIIIITDLYSTFRSKDTETIWMQTSPISSHWLKQSTWLRTSHSGLEAAGYKWCYALLCCKPEMIMNTLQLSTDFYWITHTVFTHIGCQFSVAVTRWTRST